MTVQKPVPAARKTLGPMRAAAHVGYVDPRDTAEADTLRAALRSIYALDARERTMPRTRAAVMEQLALLGWLTLALDRYKAALLHGPVDKVLPCPAAAAALDAIRVAMEG